MQRTENKYKTEYVSIIRRAKDIGHSRLLNAYCMVAYFIVLNNTTIFTPEENYGLFKNGLYANKLFHIAKGNANSYLNPRKMKKKKMGNAITSQKHENGWIVDVLGKTE